LCNKSKIIKIGGFSHIRTVEIGGMKPIAVQTMWKVSLFSSDLDSIVSRINLLESMKCDLLRFAVPDLQSADILGALSMKVSMPLVADIHFDYKIALRCMDFPIAKIRVNPGNIGGRDKVHAVLEKAGEKGIPIRIGVNAGSLPADIRKKIDDKEISAAEALVEAAMREIEVFEEFGFDNYLVSMKACTIADNIEAARIFRGKSGAPLHIGVTEAGPLVCGVARSSAALVPLLKEGLGDTIRVSLSDTEENEVIAAREILRAAGELASLWRTDAASESKAICERLRSRGVQIISCPRCGRHGFDTHWFTSRWLSKLYAMKKDITVAIMGCEVNGPIEAKNADIGITGAGDKVLIFKHGKIIRTIAPEEADTIFEEEINQL